MTTKTHALVLAGGFATRLWPLTEHRAKPLLQIGGQSIVAHIIAQIPPHVPVTVLTNAAFAEPMQAEVAQLNRPVHVWAEPSRSDGEKLGALRAVSHCVTELGITDNLALLAGDNLLPGFSFSDLEVPTNEARVIVRDIGDVAAARSFGVVETDTQGLVQRFEEKPEHPRSTLISTGFFALGSETLPHLHACAAAAPDALGGVMAHVLDQGVTVTARTHDGLWFDVGSFAAYLDAHRQLVPAQNTVDKNQNRLHGAVWISPTADVQNCTLVDAIVYDHCVLRDCHITHSVIDEHTELHRVDLNQKLIRRGTRIVGA